jgi:MFS family permease
VRDRFAGAEQLQFSCRVSLGFEVQSIETGRVRFMTLGDAKADRARRPWAFAAVCVMANALTLLLVGLTDPVIQLLPWYVAAYLLIGACIFGPTGTVPLLRQAVAFLLPGALFVVLALLNLGFWAGGWLLGLPAWGLLLSRWTPENPLRIGQLLKFIGLLVLGLVIFTLNAIYPFPSLGLFLLPVIPFVRLAYPEYRAKPLQATVEVLLGVVTVVLAFAIPAPEGAWSSPWTHAGGAATVGLLIAHWARGVPRRSKRLQLNDGVIV